MTHVIYFVAASLDGYIAGPQDELDWLPPIDPQGEDYGYQSFYAGVDGVVMGRRTYEICRRLGPWPYEGKPGWVWTRGAPPADLPPGVQATSSSPVALHRAWSREGLQRVFLVGGAQTARAFLDAGVLHEWVLATVPFTLGAGIPLFAPRPQAAAVVWQRIALQEHSRGVLRTTWRPTP